MTEQEWLPCTDPQAMLNFLRDKASDRKLRLFAVACCRRIWHLLIDEWGRHIVEVAERFADGLASESERAITERDAVFYERSFYSEELAIMAGLSDFQIANNTLCCHPEDAAAFTARQSAEAAGVHELAAQCRLLRDIFGDPFRRMIISPAWLLWNDHTLSRLAQSIYDYRAFDRLPILADALEEAGCTNADILNHCRQPGEHVRGCWVVDSLLGKS